MTSGWQAEADTPSSALSRLYHPPIGAVKMKRYIVETIWKDTEFNPPRYSSQIVEFCDIRTVKKYIDNSKDRKHIYKCTAYEVTPIVWRDS